MYYLNVLVGCIFIQLLQVQIKGKFIKIEKTTLKTIKFYAISHNVV